MSADRPSLSLVIPCYNEARGLEALAARCAKLIADAPGTEVILVDNGSTDDSAAILARLAAETPGLRIVSVPVNQGYGHGIQAGLKAARGDHLGWTHADLQTDPCDAVAAMALIRAAPDAMRVYAKGKRHGRPLADSIFTAGMSLFETALMGAWLTDINAQPNIFHRSFYESWRQPPDDFAFDLFVLVSARRAKLKLVRFPVLFGKRAFGTSHWNIDWRSKVKFIRRTVAFSLELKRGRRWTS